MVLHSRDEQEVGMAYKVISPKHQPPDNDVVVLVSANKLTDRLEML